MAKKTGPTGAYRKALALRTHGQIAKLLGISKPRVQQLEARALRRIARHPIMVQLARDEGLLVELPDQS